jgi:hypothetical protein
MAQAEAVMSIATLLAGGVRISEQAKDALSVFGDNLSDFTTVISRLIRKLDDDG